MTTAEIHFPKFHAAQKDIYRTRTGRDVWRCGRRFGKTTAIEVLAADEAIKGLKIGIFMPNYKLLAPSYKRILSMIRPLVAHSNKVDAMIELRTGGEIEFWTLNDEDAGRSRSYDGVIIDEASLVKRGLKNIWQQSIAPTLLDRRGWAMMAGTPKGIDPDNFFYEACTDKTQGWAERHMPTRMNPMLDPVGVANLINEHPPLVYQQEFLADFVDWSGAAFFALQLFMEDADPNVPGSGHPADYPPHCDIVFAVMDTATKTGKKNDGSGVTYFALSRHVGTPLTVLDWEIFQIPGSLLEVKIPDILARLEELARECGARGGSLGIFIEDKDSGQILLQQCARRGYPAHAIDSDLTAAGKDERAISVSGYVWKGMVKISHHAHAKTMIYKGQSQNHFLFQVCGFRIGEPDQADDLLDTLTYGAAIALGDREGH